MSVPAPFRAALGGQLHNGVVLFCSHQHSCLEGFDWARMDEIGDRMDKFDLFSEDQDDLATTIFGESVQLICDGEGRITLPVELMEAVHIAERAMFVGLGRKFQIWSPEMFERRRLKARDNVIDRKLTVPGAPQGRKGGEDGA